MDGETLHSAIETTLTELLSQQDIIATRKQVFLGFNKNRDALKNTRHLDALEDEVKLIKQQAMRNLPNLIKIALEKFAANGIFAVYAKDAAEARKAALQVIGDDKIVAQASTDLPVEIDLDQVLAKQGCEMITTETYCRLFQLAGDAIGIHKGVPLRYASTEDWKRILASLPDTPTSPETRYKAKPPAVQLPFSNLSERLIKNIHSTLDAARVGVTGVNAIAAQDGALLITHSLGNTNYVIQRPVHLALAGIEKIVPTLLEAWKTAYLEMLYSSGLGGATYQTMIRGPAWPTSIDGQPTEARLGSSEVHVIMIDNGRTRMIEEGFEEILYCIRCFTCHNHCPPYTALGPGIGFDFRQPGFGYKGYIGGQGTVLNYFVSSPEEAVRSGLYKCTLCGACKRECPLEIDVPRYIEKLRAKVRQQ